MVKYFQVLLLPSDDSLLPGKKTVPILWFKEKEILMWNNRKIIVCKKTKEEYTGFSQVTLFIMKLRVRDYISIKTLK